MYQLNIKNTQKCYNKACGWYQNLSKEAKEEMHYKNLSENEKNKLGECRKNIEKEEMPYNL